jgi:thiol-disulfide isomerase/thioredoxin
MNLLKQCLTAAVLLLYLPSFAQKESKRLKIGDTVPDLVLNNIINYKSNAAKLSDFKGKAIILDFWNKNCGSCISAMPEMQELQAQFKDDLVVLLVNDQINETRENLEFLFEKSNIVKNTALPMVLSNSIFGNKSELFPHWGVPFHVWIDKDRIVRATTGGESATSENVRELIAGRNPKVQIRIDLLKNDVDTSRFAALIPALEMQKGVFRKNLVYYNKIKPSPGISDVNSGNNSEYNIIDPVYPYYTMLMIDPLPELGNYSAMGTFVVDSKSGEQIGVRYNHRTALQLYSEAYNVFGKNLNVLVETKDADQYYPPKKNSSEDILNWDKSKLFIYESVLPNNLGNNKEKRQDVLKHDLEAYFGMVGNIELRSLKCFIFYRTDQSLKLQKTKGGDLVNEDTKSNRGYVMKNVPSYFLIQKFKNLNADKKNIAVIDETGIDHEKTGIDLTIHSNFDDISTLNKELQKYGIGIREETRQLPALILTKAK